MDILSSVDVLGPVGPLVATFLLGFTTVVLLFWYSSRKQNYWQKQGVPYVKPYPVFGSVLENMSQPRHFIDVERFHKYGRIYGHYEGNKPLLSVAEPELLRSILVKDFHAFTGRRQLATNNKMTEKFINMLQGEDWKRVRTIVTPTFTTGKIKRVLGIFHDCAKTLVQNFKRAATKGEPVQAKSYYGAFLMDIIASSAFSTKIDSYNDPNNKFVQNALAIFTRSLNWRSILILLMPGVMKFFKIGIFSSKGLKFFADVTLQIIEERKRTGQTRNDFLQLLMDTTKVQKEDKLDLGDEADITENYGSNEGEQVFKNAYIKKTLSFDELVAQCITFFLAGYDTTASTLSFATYLLALNLDVQEKLIKELDGALRETNGELTYEAVQGLKYLDNIISETLRIFPPAVRLDRVADEDYKLGDTGIVIPKGMIVTIPVYAIHRDPEFFPTPEKFDPDRFNQEERIKRHQYAYLPFGAGPRNCVGMRFALMEVKVCLAYVISNFRIKKCSKTKVPLDFVLGPGLLQAKGINVEFEIRKDTIKEL